jgi:hypothetical protein
VETNYYNVGVALYFLFTWTVTFLLVTAFISPFVIIAAIFAASRRPRR